MLFRTENTGIWVPGLKRVLVFVALLMTVPALLATHSFAQQEKERLLERYVHQKEPLRIKAIKGKKGMINISKKFLDDDDWLKGLSISLENISEKSITYIQLEIEFPRPDDVPPLVFPVVYGQGLLPDSESTVKSPAIKPGEEVVLSLSQEAYAVLKQSLDEEKYSKSIKHAIVDLRSVIFDDGIMWRAGRLMKRDPNDPRRWISINRTPEAAAAPNNSPAGNRPGIMNIKSFLSDGVSFLAVNYHEAQPSSPAPQACDDYTTIVTLCNLSCNVDDDRARLTPYPVTTYIAGLSNPSQGLVTRLQAHRCTPAPPSRKLLTEPGIVL